MSVQLKPSRGRCSIFTFSNYRRTPRLFGHKQTRTDRSFNVLVNRCHEGCAASLEDDEIDASGATEANIFLRPAHL